MATTGAKAPTAAVTAAEDPWLDNDWTTPENIYGAGEASVTAATFDAGDQTYVLKAQGFDFSVIPDLSTILGVTCVINARYATVVVSIDLCQLLNTSGSKVGTNHCATPVALTTTAANYTEGGSGDTWGNSLTAAWVKDADFGVAIGCLAGGSGNSNNDVYIDSVTLEVTYTPPTPAISVSDSLGLSADATLSGLETDREVSKSEGLGLAAVSSLELPIGASAAEGLGLATAPIVAMADMTASLADGLGLSCAATLALADLDASVAESLGLADAPSAETETGPLSVQASETLGLSATAGHYSETLVLWESPPVVVVLEAGALSIDVADGLGLSDTASAELVLALATAESFTLGDVPLLALDALAIAAGDGLGLADLATVAVGALEALNVSASDTLGLAAEATLSAGVEVVASETLGLAGEATVSIGAAGVITISVTDALAMSDAPAASLADLVLSAAETVGLGDAATAMVLLGPLVSDGLGLADVPVAALGALAASVADSLGVSDQAMIGIGAAGDVNVSVSDGLGVSASPAIGLLLEISDAEALGFGDVATAAMGDLALAVADSLGIADAVMGLYIGVDLFLAVSDSLALGTGIVLSVISMHLVASAADRAAYRAGIEDIEKSGVSIADLLTGRITVSDR